MTMTHQIRTSERRSFRGCRRRWDWAYVQGFTPMEAPRPLEFGQAFHSGFEALYDPETWGITTPEQKLFLAKRAFEAECERQRQQYLKDMGVIRLDYDQKDDYDERIILGCKMLEYYVENVHKVSDSWFKPVRVEVEFDVPVTDDKGGQVYCGNSPCCGQVHDNPALVTHGGRVDALVEDLIHGGYWVVDWKTAASLRATAEMLDMDDQVCTYCWALREKLKIDIRGFIYVEIRKDYPRPPKELKRSRNGCKFSTDKSQPTTAKLYREYVAKHDAAGYASGCYNEFLLYLETDKDAAKFHQRFEIRKTPAQLRNVGYNLAMEAQDMTREDLLIYPSVGRFSCPTCAYRTPCTARFSNEDYQYTLDTLFRKVK